jgi:hypothetical protein
MDCIIKLYLSKESSQIWVVVDCFPKMADLFLITDDLKSVLDFASVFEEEI